MSVAGILLAAGAGRRAGGPKALRRFEDGEAWVHRAAVTLRDGGCDPVLVVVGAEADVVSALVPSWAVVVRCEDWTEGMGASVRAGLEELTRSLQEVVAVLIGLVDTPGVGAAAVARIAALASPSALARALYRGEPGHPVLIGRDHWVGVSQDAVGDRGARDYLAGHDVRLVECADLGSGEDRDAG